MARINWRTIGGRFIFMSVLFTIVITSLTVLIVIQNERSAAAINVIQEVRIPLRLITGNIIGSLDRVMSQQRAYMLSGNSGFKEERANVYNEDIYPAIQKLLVIKQKIPSEQRAAIDQIQKDLKEFEQVQVAILDFFEDQMLPHMQDINKTEAGEWMNLTESFVAKLKAEKEISERIKLADNVRAKLLRIMTELRNAQEKLLTDEINAVTMGMRNARFMLVTSSIAVFIFLVAYTTINTRSLRHSIQKPVMLINSLAAGSLPEKIDETKDELNEIMEAGGKLTQNIRAASEFALAIGEGKLEEYYQAASDHDVLGKSLLHMRERLQAISLDEQRRNWATSGIAELGNLLRRQTENTSEFYDSVLAYVIKFLKANQGALYLAEEKDNEVVLELASCHAFNKKKYINQTIFPGQGLVGQVFLEKEFVLLTAVPRDYVHITSGLGEATPRCVIICPLLLNAETFGIIEMASFTVFASHEIDFIKRAAEQITAVIASVKSAHHTAKLLEASQQQQEELRSQEEEMRQNMEELSATQEEMSRKESEYIRRIRELEARNFTFEKTKT